MPIAVFGDSHGFKCMSGVDCHNFSQNSITMHRIGRDKIIPGFNPNFNHVDNTFVFYYGEVDCRCHVFKQLALGRNLDDIIEELTTNFIETIKLNITAYKQIIIGSIVPPIKLEEYLLKNEPVTHEFPFLGTDQERVLYTQLMNKSLKDKCSKNEFTFLDLYNDYARTDGTLVYELSDGVCHIGDNSMILEKLRQVLKN